MTLPTFRSLAVRRKEKKAQKDGTVGPTSSDARSSEQTTTPPSYTTGVDIKKATSTRRNAVIVASFFFFISVIFLILTIIGNINKKAVIRNTYFFKINLTNIIPASTPADIEFVNSLARSLGLHDFYQVGLWDFCEGYENDGITDCSKPTALYWFNPVEIIINELVSGATIALPAEINSILNLIKIASHLMFGFFLTGVCMNFVAIFITPVALYSRWWSFPIAVFTFISALLTAAATIIATVMFVIFRNVLTSQTTINIGASLGAQMFAFMWIGTIFSIVGFVIHLCLSCCCASTRDVKTGRKRGNKKAYGDQVFDEKKTGARKRRFAVPRFGRKTAGDVV